MDPPDPLCEAVRPEPPPRTLGIKQSRSSARPKSLGPWVTPVGPKTNLDASPISSKVATLPKAHTGRALFAHVHNDQDNSSHISRSKFYVEDEFSPPNSPPKPPPDLFLLSGEEIQGHPVPNVTYVCPYNGAVDGDLIITNYRLYFKNYDRAQPLLFDVPLGVIQKIEKRGKVGSRGEHSYGIDVFCADFRNLRFACRQENHARRSVFETLHTYAFPVSRKMELFAFNYRETFHSDGWRIYDARGEFARLGVPSKNWAFTPLNENYGFCDTYPRVLAVPSDATEDEIRGCASFRSRQRIPVLCWLDPEGKAAIVRCSQPLVGVGGRRNRQDERYVQRLAESNPVGGGRLAIMDARPLVNAIANKARGGGYESEDCYPFADIIFLDIHNIHVMRDSLRKVKDLAFPGVDDARWFSSLAASSWVDHVKCVLSGAARIADKVHNSKCTCLVHCSDGWDRTPQMTALAMVMLDPYYRTLTGFQVLIEKEWVSFGHKFNQRIGHGEDKPTDANRSPIFIQWIDCVWQMTYQFPYAFEFNEDFLIFVLDQLYSCRFGTFICGSEKEHCTRELSSKTVSLWSYVNSRREAFLNPEFLPEDRQPRVVIPVASMRQVKLWTGYYCRWNCQFPHKEPASSSTADLEALRNEMEQRLNELTVKRGEDDFDSKSGGSVEI